MNRTGRVISVSVGSARVALYGLEQCQRCARGDGCGLGIFSAQSGSEIELDCATQLPVSADQKVTVAVEEQGNDWLWAVVGAYGLPTLGLLLAAVIGAWYIEPWLSERIISLGFLQPGTMALYAAEIYDAVTVICAVAGLIGGVIAWRLLAPHVLAFGQQSLCLHSARIVAVHTLNLGEPE